MSFDIASTPTLEVVATTDEQLLAQDLRARVEEATREADAQAEVAEAAESARLAKEHLDRLRKAERTLTQHAKESREKMAAVSRTALDAIIESAGSGGKLEFKKLNELAAVEDQDRVVTRAIQRIVEQLIPVAQIASLREESHALMTKARAVERIAQGRAERVLGQLRDAVTEEVVLPVDLSKGVAGALLAHAAGLKRRAIQLSESADRMERGHEYER